MCCFLESEKEGIGKKIESFITRLSKNEEIYQWLGIHIEMKQDQICIVHFTKISIKEPWMKFTFQILVNDENVKGKILS